MARSDPRLAGVADQPFVRIGDWYEMQNVGFISGGQSSSDTVNSYEDGVKFLNFYMKSLYNNGGDARGIYMALYFAAAGTGGGEAARFNSIISAAYTSGTINGVHSTVALTTGGSEAGSANGGRFTLEANAATRTLTGTYASLQVDSYLGTGNTVDGQKVSFIRFADVGDVKMPYVFDFSSLTAADSAAAVQADSGAVSTIYGYARVLCPGGAVGYICIYAAHS